MKCDQLYRLALAAKMFNLNRSTLATAIERGEIEVAYTACGLPLVTLAEIDAWTKQVRKVGRPRKHF